MIEVYLESAERRVFALAVDWPGWARSGRDDAAALEALVAYGERYRRALGTKLGPTALPTDAGRLRVVERVKGGATTDFGAPGEVPELDGPALREAELARLVRIHAACWAAFRRAARRAQGKTLAPSGPRGGGRSADRIVEHVVGAENAYRRGLGGSGGELGDEPDEARDAFVAQLRERAAGRVDDLGPRGGRRWPPRYAVRRSCWHLLDHAWEIEDRLAG